MILPSPSIRLTTGYSRLPARPMIAVALTPGELATLARALDREADDARIERRDGDADRLESRAVALREAVR